MSILSPDESIRLKKQDPEMIEKIYETYKDKIYSFILMKLKGNRMLADDIFSDAIHSILVSFPKLKSNKNIFSWMIQITYRRLCDYLNKINNDVELIDEVDQHSDKQENMDAGIIKKEELMQFNLGLDRINPKYKELLTLKYIKKLSQKEIAKQLNKTEKAVESIIMRAKAALKKELLKCDARYFT